MHLAHPPDYPNEFLLKRVSNTAWFMARKFGLCMEDVLEAMKAYRLALEHHNLHRRYEPIFWTHNNEVNFCERESQVIHCLGF